MQKNFFSRSAAFTPLFVVALVALLILSSAQSVRALENQAVPEKKYEGVSRLQNPVKLQNYEGISRKKRQEKRWIQRFEFVDNSLEMQQDRYVALEKFQELEDEYDNFDELSYEDRRELKAEMRERWHSWREQNDMRDSSIVSKRAQRAGW